MVIGLRATFLLLILQPTAHMLHASCSWLLQSACIKFWESFGSLLLRLLLQQQQQQAASIRRNCPATVAAVVDGLTLPMSMWAFPCSNIPAVAAADRSW